jgi:hypothetical protein
MTGDMTHEVTIEGADGRLDEREARALKASPGPWRPNSEHTEVLAVDDIPVADGFALSGNQLRATVDHISSCEPERMFRRANSWPCRTLKALALPLLRPSRLPQGGLGTSLIWGE